MNTSATKGKRLAVALGIAALAAVTSARAEFADTTDMVFRYEMDEVGEDGLVANSGGTYTRPAIATNGVATCKAQAKCLAGFANDTSFMCVTNVGAATGSAWNTDFTFVVWVRNPDLSDPNKRLIVRSGGDGGVIDGYNKGVAWQAWIEPSDGALALGMLATSGKSYSSLTADGGVRTALTWKPDTWYQVAIVHSFVYDKEKAIFT